MANQAQRPADIVAEAARAADRLHLRAAPGLIAVSGGADSVALLHLARDLGLAVAAAHFHHHLRGADADADADFVQALAARVGVDHHRGDGDTPGERGNAEAAARRLRYAWLAAVARETGAAWVATAHTADDQAETVLLNLLRGTGLRGLAGIAEARDLAGVRLVRPLLGVRRGELRAWLAHRNEPHREDATNRDAARSRAWVRAELLPRIEGRNAAAIPAIARAAAQARRAAEAEARDCDRLLRALELPRAGAWVVLDARAWQRLAPEDRAAVVRRVYEREAWPARELGAATLRRVAEAAAPADLPGGVRLELAPGAVRLGRGS